MDDLIKIAEQWGRNHSLLVVDDEAIVRLAFAKIAETHHCDITFAATVEEAHDQLRRNKFDFIFLDLKLDGGDGLDVLRYLNRENLDSHVTIMSGSVNLGDIVAEANNLGVLSFFAKPVAFTPEFVKKILVSLRVRLVPKTPTSL